MSRWQQTGEVPLNKAALAVACPACDRREGYPCRTMRALSDEWDLLEVPHHARKDRFLRLIAHAARQARWSGPPHLCPVPDSQCTALGLEERRRQGVGPVVHRWSAWDGPTTDPRLGLVRFRFCLDCDEAERQRLVSEEINP